MADARQRSDWDKLSWLAAMFINSQKRKGDRLVQPARINPYLADRKRRKRVKPDIAMMAAMLGISGPPLDARPCPGPLSPDL